jgi:predicted GIY-YIG superfamily endonuclease
MESSPTQSIPQEINVSVTTHRGARSVVISFDPRSRRETWTPALFGMTNPPVYEAARVGAQKGESTVVWLYRFYDAEMVLLYIGITINPPYRWTEHMHNEWWQTIRFASIEAIPPKERYRLETIAIRAEQPLHNVTQKAPPIGRPALLRHPVTQRPHHKVCDPDAATNTPNSREA